MIAPYALLDIKPGATRQAIGQAYHRAVKDLSPDDPDLPLLRMAYHILSTPGLRQRYDHMLATGEPPRIKGRKRN